jgi:hypothetical protein
MTIRRLPLGIMILYLSLAEWHSAEWYFPEWHSWDWQNDTQGLKDRKTLMRMTVKKMTEWHS